MSKNKKAREQQRAVNESGDLCRKDGFLSSTAAKPQEHQNLQKEKGGKHRITQTTKMFYQGMRDMGEVEEGHVLNVKSCFSRITQLQIHTFLWVAVMPVWKKCAEKNIQEAHLS